MDSTTIAYRTDDETAHEIILLSTRLSSPDDRFAEFACASGVEPGLLSMKERVELLARFSLVLGGKTTTHVTMLSLKDLTKRELRKLLQTIRDIEENDPERPISVTVNVSNLSKRDIEEVLSYVKPEIKARRNLHDPARPNLS